jgi:hypothetical protein
MFLQFPNVRNNVFFEPPLLILGAIMATSFTFVPLFWGYGLLRLSYALWADLRDSRVKRIYFADYDKHKKAQGLFSFTGDKEQALPQAPNTQIYLMPRSLRILSIEEAAQE